MTYVMCFATVKEARFVMKELIHEHKDETITVDCKRGLIKQGDNEYYFLCWNEYEIWRLGRKYVMDGHLYMGEYLLLHNYCNETDSKWYSYYVDYVFKDMEQRRNWNDI